MEVLKNVVIGLFLTGAGYLLGKTHKELELKDKKDKDDARVFQAQKHALNLTDDDIDALARMYDKFDK